MPSEILIVEDNEDVRAFLSASLAGVGYSIVEAEDGAAALTRLAYLPPALVLLDLHMPVIDGLDVLKRLRSVAAWQKTPILILTASGRTDDLVEARRLGARGYLMKPILPADLAAKIARVLGDPNLIWFDDLTELRAR